MEGTAIRRARNCLILSRLFDGLDALEALWVREVLEPERQRVREAEQRRTHRRRQQQRIRRLAKKEKP